jgi:colanic acid biosynthesis glycosyl transferase WcaI
MPPLRVCFFNRSYWPDHGATGQLLTELAEGLVREYACKISVVVGPPLSNGNAAAAHAKSWMPVRRELRNRVEIFRAASTVFKPQRFAGRAANYLSYFLSACLAGLWVPRPDVVVSLTDPPIIGLAALLTARRTGARFVFLCQDVFPEVAWLLDDFHSPRLNRLLDRINRLLIRKADQVIVLGETMRERLIAGKGADPQKVKVIHNWADCSAIVPGSKRNPFSVAHGLAEAFVVMHSGNIGLSQSLDTLVDAADRLRSYPDLLLAMVGDGAKRQTLEARARSLRLTNLRFFPYQPKESLKDSFASADMFVVSLKRGLAGYIVPSKLYGILAAGRPYVAAVEEACEVVAITRQYDCGLVVEPGDAKGLADTILTLYHDRAMAQRLGANARRTAQAFDRPRQVRAYYNLFRELLSRPTTLP